MRIAYLIMSYRPPDQLLRLVNTLRRAEPDAVVVVHHDRFRSTWDHARLGPGVDVRTSDTPVSWGDFSIVDATWTTLAWMVAHRTFDWVVFLSEQDYPVAPAARLQERLAQSEVDAFIDARPIDRIADPDLKMDCERRYNYRYTKVPRVGLMARLPPGLRTRIADAANYANFVLYKLQRAVTVYRYPDPLPLRLGVRPRRSPYTADFPCWYGSQWMALSRRAAEMVVAYVARHPDYVAHCARTVIPDESATATIVCNDPDLAVHHENLHLVRFGAHDDGHPEVFGLRDVDTLVASGCFFARKFDVSVDSAVLDALDAQLWAG